MVNNNNNNSNNNISFLKRYSPTNVKSRNFLTNISYNHLKHVDFDNALFVIDFFTYILFNLNPLFIEQKFGDVSCGNFVKNLWKSDFHKITVTVLKSHLNKLGPKIIHYRDYKNFSNDAFRSVLVIENGNLQNLNDLDSLLAKCKNILNRKAPLKQK